MDRNEAIEIPFGAFDSELKGWEYTIPKGMEAVIKDGKIIVREKESEDEKIRKEIIGFLNAINKDTLEVKEVDLEKEIHDYHITKKPTVWFNTLEEIAKHFFELGLKANNPITSADRGTAEEIIINLKKIESDYNVCLTKEIEWVRKQVGQPELKAKQG